MLIFMLVLNILYSLIVVVSMITHIYNIGGFRKLC